MAFSYTRLAAIGSVATGTSASVYTNPVSTISFVTGIIIHNTSGGPLTVTLNNVPNSSGALGTVALTNQFLKIAINSNDTFFLDLNHPLVLNGVNDALFGLASGSGITIQVLGNLSQ